MAYIPLNYDQLNNIAGHYSPSMVKAYNNEAFAFWVRSLLQRATSRIDCDLPDNWQGSTRDFLLYCLLAVGFVFVSKNEKLGYWFNPGTVYGFDFYYQPTTFLLANPRAQEAGLLEKTEFEIHKDGDLLKFMPDRRGILDIIEYYAEKLAAMDNAINMSIINSKFSFVLAGKNKATVEALKKMFDKINRGEPAVFLDKALMNDPNDGEEPFQFVELQKLKENYITDQQLQDFQSILNSFDSEIGIPTTPYFKAERMVTSEAESKTTDSQARLITAIECLQSSVKDIKKLYPDIKLDFRLREPERQEVQTDGKDNIDRNV